MRSLSVCAGCGAYCSRGQMYCSNCGADILDAPQLVPLFVRKPEDPDAPNVQLLRRVDGRRPPGVTEREIREAELAVGFLIVVAFSIGLAAGHHGLLDWLAGLWV